MAKTRGKAGPMLVTALMAGLAATGASAQSGGGNAERGLAYAERVCARCHGVRLEDVTSFDEKATPFRIIANSPGMTGMALYVFFRTPHPNMPNLVIEERDQLDLIAYIESLKGR